MTAYSMVNQTALFAGDKQPVHRYIMLAQQPGLAVPAAAPGVYANPVNPNLLLRGTALGKIPAPAGSPAGTPPTYILSKAGATDGSQHLDCVLAADVDASQGPVEVPAYFDGEFAFERMYFDQSWASFAQVDADLQAEEPGWYCRQLGILG